MKDIARWIVNIIQVLSFCALMVLGIMGVLYELLGYVKFEKLLSAIGISKGFDRIWVVGPIVLVLLGVTYAIKVKFF